MGAVEFGEAVRVARKMRGSPIEKDAEARVVAAIDKVHEIGGSAVAAGGGKIADGLVAPGAVEGMLHDGEQLDVGIAEFLYVGDELIAQFAIGEPAAAFFWDAAPGAEMDFVDGDGFLEPIRLGALGNPRGVIPLIGIQVGDDRTGLRAQLGAEGVGIGLERDHVSVGADDFVFVDGAFIQFGDKKLPNSGGAASAHRIYTAIPMIEIANYADAATAGRPDGEIDAAHTFESLNVCAELIVGVVVAAFAHQVQIEFAEEEWEGVSIELLEGCAGGEAILNAVGRRRGAILLSFGKRGFKEAVGTE